MAHEHPSIPHGWLTRPEMVIKLGHILGKRPEARLRIFIASVKLPEDQVRRIEVGKRVFNVYSPEVMQKFLQSLKLNTTSSS